VNAGPLGGGLRMHGYSTRSVRLLATPLLLAVVAGGMAPATASAARAGRPGPVASFTTGGNLEAVSATSASSAWAVGCANRCSRTLTERWNGTAWTQVPSPGPAGSVLSGVADVSAGSAWAVGNAGGAKTLILRWNGTAWK
jgi:hypothetical protein